MLVDFNHTQAVFVILVDNGFDTGRFTGTTVTKQQYIVCFLSLYKRFRIVYQLLFLNLISDQIVQHNGIHIVDCTECKASLRCIINPECFVETKHSNTVVFIKPSHCIKEFFFILCRLQFFA